jgi:hypothetical protein
MIDERVLGDVLEEMAADISVPESGPREVVEAVEAIGPRGPRRWITGRSFLAVAAAIVVIVGSVGFLAARRTSHSANLAQKAILAPHDQQSSLSERQGGVTSGTRAATGGGTTAAGAAAAGTAALPAPLAPAPAPLPPLETKVVKTGSVTLVVGKGRFEATMGQLLNLASSQGGYAAGTSTNQSPTGPSGSVTLRVPGPSFETTLSQVRTYGRVDGSSTKGDDVTAQYVDLTARITTLSAARDRYLAILSTTRAVQDILAVQQHIDDLNGQLEQLRGQQRVLDDQTSYATLTVTFSETGTTPPAPRVPKPRSDWSKAFHSAGHRFLAAVRWVITASGVVAFILLVLGLALAVGLLVRRLLRHPAL